MPSQLKRRHNNDDEIQQRREIKTYRSKLRERETDPRRLRQRQKQINFGKNTVGYCNYIRMVPKHKREKHHPRTPDKYGNYSKRAWDGIVRVWRKELHKWDPVPNNESDSIENKYKDIEDLNKIESELEDLQKELSIETEELEEYDFMEHEEFVD